MPSYLVSTPPSISGFDYLTIESDTSISIDQVRQITSFLSRKPQSSLRSTVIIHSSHTATIPAQNALLKILEEPPIYADIYLVTDKPDLLIPTIHSRVFSSKQPIRTVKADPDIQKLVSEFLSISSTGHKLKLLDYITTRDHLAHFLDQYELYIHHHLYNQPHLANHYIHIQNSRKYLISNCNLKLLLTYLVSLVNTKN